MDEALVKGLTLMVVGLVLYKWLDGLLWGL